MIFVPDAHFFYHNYITSCNFIINYYRTHHVYDDYCCNSLIFRCMWIRSTIRAHLHFCCAIGVWTVAVNPMKKFMCKKNIIYIKQKTFKPKLHSIVILIIWIVLWTNATIANMEKINGTNTHTRLSVDDPTDILFVGIFRNILIIALLVDLPFQFICIQTYVVAVDPPVPLLSIIRARVFNSYCNWHCYS